MFLQKADTYEILNNSRTGDARRRPNMDTFIQDASKGSAILAYGTKGSSPKSIAIKILIAAAILLGVFLLFLFWTFAFGSATLPSKPLFEIAVKPKDVMHTLNGALITELPAPWRTALESESRFPAILGIAETKNGKLAPFALIAKTTSITAQAEESIISSSLVTLISSSDIETTQTPYRRILKLLGLKKKNDLSWTIDQRLLQAFSGYSPSQESSRDQSVFGTLKGARGSILLPSETVTSENSEGAFFVMLGNTDASARNISPSLRAQGLNMLNARDPNKLLLTGNGTLQANWNELSDVERQDIAIALGHSSGSPFILPDNDLISTILPIASGTEKELVITHAWKQPSGEPVTWKSNCPGTIRFAINGDALQNLLLSFKTPAPWREKIRSFSISTEGKENLFCINE